jgi:hypothetical protein
VSAALSLSAAGERQRLTSNREGRKSRDGFSMKVIYKITYPNGKIYVGKDLTGTLELFPFSISQAPRAFGGVKSE